MPTEECIMLFGVYREISSTLGLREGFNKAFWKKWLQGKSANKD